MKKKLHNIFHIFRLDSVTFSEGKVIIKINQVPIIYPQKTYQFTKKLLNTSVEPKELYDILFSCR